MELKPYSVGGAVPPSRRRLHLNEFRFPHAPEVEAALRDSLDRVPIGALLTHYRAGAEPELADDLARYVGAPSRECVLVAPGSDEVLRAAIDLAALRGHRAVLMGVPGYTHFAHYVRLRGLGLEAYSIGLATGAADHEAALRYYAPLLAEGCLAYLCSPNNPTGDLWAPAALAALAAEYPRSLFLVDEAYVEFAGAEAADAKADDAAVLAVAAGADPDAAALNCRSLVPVALACGNVLVARTMSKAFGLAALRVGYAVGPAALVAELGVAVSPKGLSPLAGPVARAALDALGHYREAAACARSMARSAVAALRRAGWWALDAPANFFLVYVGDSGDAVARLAAHSVQVRDRGDMPGLAGFVRVTAGGADDLSALLGAFDRLPLPAAPPPQALYYTNKGTIAAVKWLVRRTAAALRAVGVPFWAQGGTMLGMFRHRRREGDAWAGGAVPWDDDADLAYLRADDGGDPLAPHVALFAAAGLTLQRNRTDAYWQAGTNAPGTIISPVHVDVFSYSRREYVSGFRFRLGDERFVSGPAVVDLAAHPAISLEASARYTLDDERFRDEDPGSPQAHCNTSYSHDELFPLSDEYLFYDVRIPMPAQPEVVLRRALGDDFMRVARARVAADGSLAEFALRDLAPA